MSCDAPDSSRGMDRLSPVVLWMDAADGCTDTSTQQQQQQQQQGLADDVEMNELPVSVPDSVAAVSLSSPGLDAAGISDLASCRLALEQAQRANMRLMEENNALRMQLRAATTPVPLAQQLRSYARALFFGRTGYFTSCSLMLIVAAALGFAITMGQFGDYLFGFEFNLNSIQKVIFLLGLNSYSLEFEFLNLNQPATILKFAGPFCEFNSKTCLGAVPQLFDYLDAIGLASLLLLQCITVPCLSAISSDIVRRIAKLWFPLASCVCLAVVTSLAAWKLFAPLVDFARRRADDITAGQRSSGGGGAADESLFELVFTPTTRAFFALIAVLSASALPLVFLLLVFARRKFVAQQQVLPT